MPNHASSRLPLLCYNLDKFFVIPIFTATTHLFRGSKVWHWASCSPNSSTRRAVIVLFLSWQIHQYTPQERDGWRTRSTPSDHSPCLTNGYLDPLFCWCSAPSLQACNLWWDSQNGKSKTLHCWKNSRHRGKFCSACRLCTTSLFSNTLCSHHSGEDQTTEAENGFNERRRQTGNFGFPVGIYENVFRDSGTLLRWSRSSRRGASVI